MILVNNIFEKLCELAPLNSAYEWDNSGLQLGSLQQKVKRVLLTLDVTQEVVEEAVNYKCQLILAHHPLIFKGLSKIDLNSNKGKIIITALKENISILSFHSNLDLADGGLNDYFASMIGLNSISPLKLENSPGKSFALGRIASLSESCKALDFAHELKEKLKLDYLKYCGNPGKIVKKIAVCTGSGADLIQNALSSGADVFITADVKYHEAQSAEAKGLFLIDVGHYHSEVIVQDLMEEYLGDNFTEVEFIKSKINTNPWYFL